ncbi:cyclic nucleotide-binding domain-containing protein [Gloeocapsa sp. PCC 73106]|uniref:cyclic nucleotide-binding domain-containing protein n=1 Tax=Gloeocapsa sp. PCC 73106 TaxID=102232 RepID=UPI0002ABE617|nr:cyclic nucleotide-binding domain-containing protein [Gloeocapsa sp. PCC 73106]ELR97120.1 cyclic nucleotide-binding protein [Gloeocapsa sp. PCC 73106]
MHRIRWVTTSVWLLLIASLFYDPISPWLTYPGREWSPLRVSPDSCVNVQGVCLKQEPYALGAPIFWGLIVPSAIFILLVFGHELWRRICPLSFLSQLAIALKWQRQKKRVDAKTGKVRYEILKIKKDSWLGRNYLYFQFGWLYLGLCFRILFINADRLALGLWLLFTISVAIIVGYLYGGKSWCQYFCPMAPVQKIYAEPGGLFTTKAHMSERQITQSMCRSTSKDGQERSACVACNTPCIDIDSERSYWEGINRADNRFIYYAYFGLVVGYFLYYYLYAGNWSYYFSGAWAHQANQIQTIFNPGFYLFNHPIPIPKLVAVPLTLGLFSWLGYSLGKFSENRYKYWLRQGESKLTSEQIRHRIFTLCTYLIFNIFFIFGGRPFVLLLPLKFQYIYELILVLLSTLWLYKTWRRNPEVYNRESLANRFRNQLGKLNLNIGQFLEGKSLADLNIHEVYVLTKVLPGFTKEKRHQAYKGVLKDALEEGYTDTSSSLEVLQQMRIELDVTEEEHRQILIELGVEDPQLLEPNRLKDRENLVRLNGYRKALERIITWREKDTENTLTDILENHKAQVNALSLQYSITPQEEAEILADFDPQISQIRKAQFLLNKLEELIDAYRAINQPLLLPQAQILALLRVTLQEKKSVLVRALLTIFANLGEQPEVISIASTLGSLSPVALVNELESKETDWQSYLTPKIMACLKQPGQAQSACSLEVLPEEIVYHLELLLAEPNPLIQSLSLYVIYHLDPVKGTQIARARLEPNQNILVQETAQNLINLQEEPNDVLAAFPYLEKLVYMSNTDFFRDISSEIFLELAEKGDFRVYQAKEVITTEGDTCRELLLLVAGEAIVNYKDEKGVLIQESFKPGQILDELEVLSHGRQAGTIMAQTTPTRILAIPVDTFDEVLDRDHHFARKVLALESRRLQDLLQSHL